MKILTIFSFLALAGISTFVMFNEESEAPRSPASIPQNYEGLSACEKQDILWQKAQSSVYKELPDFKKMGLTQLLAMGMQELKLKGELHSDFSPPGWKKYLHRRGSLVKVKIVPAGNKYSGIFQGAECAMLRLSLTYKPEGDKAVAPGLALKILRDKVHSANVSALVAIEGQGEDFNFFKNPMSNIVPTGNDIGHKLVHHLFKRVTYYPEELVLTDMAQINSQGEKSEKYTSPRQIFFIPDPGLVSSSKEHDIRNDFAQISEGSVLYRIYALPVKYSHFDYSNYKREMVNSFIKESEHVADIITTSEFISSEFGDDGIFFRHQLRP